MNLPANCHLAYVVAKEAWYAHVTPDPPTIWISVNHSGGGSPWEFSVFEVEGIGVKLGIFDDAWPAFNDLPEFFQALATKGKGTTLDDVRQILDNLGAVDSTERERR